MPPAGLAVALHQRGRRRSRDRPAPAPARPPPRPRQAPPAAGRPQKSRLRGSIPITTGRSRAPPAKSRGRKLIGRLSIASKPRSSSAPIAVDRPAPAGPLMMTMCCPAQGVLPQSPCTPCPTNVRACLSRERRGRSARKCVNASVKIWDIAPGNQFNIDSQTRDCHRLWHSCRGVGGRGRPPAPATASGAAGSRRSPTPRASISPASASGAWRPAPPPAPTSPHPVVGDQRRAPADQRQRQRRLARARARRESAARGRRRPPPSRAESPSPRHRLGPGHRRAFPSGRKCESNRTSDPNSMRHTGALLLPVRNRD